MQAAPAAKQLQKGIEAYQNQNNEKAMEYFVDVLMNGDNEQVSLANKYIDAIHNNMGGIKNPVEVKVSFPEQPVQTMVDPSGNLANYGREKLDTFTTSSEQIVKETQALLQTPKTLTEQIEERQLEGYTQQAGVPVVAAEDGMAAKSAFEMQPAVVQIPSRKRYHGQGNIRERRSYRPLCR